MTDMENLQGFQELSMEEMVAVNGGASNEALYIEGVLKVSLGILTVVGGIFVCIVSIPVGATMIVAGGTTVANGATGLSNVPKP